MSEFKSMSVVVQSPKTFIEPVKLSPLKSFWHRVTGKDVPTVEFPHLHTIELDDTHDASMVENLFDRLDTAEYELVSLIVDGYDFTEEMVKHVHYLSNVPLFFEALINDSYNADVICAFITERDCADVENWMDPIHFSGSSHEEVVTEWMEVFHKVYTPVYRSYRDDDYVETAPVPSWMTVDWEDTLDSIARDNSSSVVEFGGMVYFFGE